jgi:hypothetical protein
MPLRGRIMSKNKEIEKIKSEKERIKLEKLEKSEQKEIKEPFKEKIEYKEFKEGKREKIEQKEKIEIKEQGKIEIKELEKDLTEKGGKEIAEAIQPGGEVFQVERAAVDPAKQKEFEKIQKDKELEKIQKDIEKFKPEKEQGKLEKLEKFEHKEKPEKFEHKEKFEKEKIEIKEHGKIETKEFEKDVFEKGGKELVETTQPGGGIFQAQRAAAAKPKEAEKLQKEIEKIKPEKEGKLEKLEKFEHKEFKIEFKDAKLELAEKVFLKDFQPEKGPLEGPGKGIAEGPATGEPTKIFEGTGTPEDRLGRLEDAVTRLSHFIGVDLRPDLTAGALTQEPDVKTDQPGEESKTEDQPKTEVKPKKPGR